MKKYIILALLFLPVAAFSAPSVRVLGSKTDTNTTTTKAAPAKLTNTSGVTTSRIGTVRTKPTGTVASVKTGAGADSRFPGIGTSSNLHVVKQQAKPSVTVVTTSEVDAEQIEDAIMEKIQEKYYDKEQVYNNSNFEQAVLDIDDPRIDAIKIGKPSHSAALDSNYVYMWIEE